MPDARADSAPLIRVTKGHPSPEELAALTVALFLRAGAPAPEDEQTRGHVHRPATWRRLERALTHRGARSWRDELRRTRPRSQLRS